MYYTQEERKVGDCEYRIKSQDKTIKLQRATLKQLGVKKVTFLEPLQEIVLAKQDMLNALFTAYHTYTCSLTEDDAEEPVDTTSTL